MAEPLKLLSSMATRALLAELVGQYRLSRGVAVELEAVGGVDAARRVAEGEPVDIVVLASNAMDSLAKSGRVDPASRANVVRSAMAVAVRSGAEHPDIGTEAALRDAVRAAPSIGYSTGPSGTHFLSLLAKWGIEEEVAGRVVQAPPGVPVGTFIAQGRAAIGFQQLSELTNVPGIDVLGPLPGHSQLLTYFTAAVAEASIQKQAAQEFVRFLMMDDNDTIKRRHGMDPA